MKLPRSSAWRTSIAVVFAAVAGLHGCDCEDDLVEIPKASCEPETTCKENQAYRFGKCVSTYCEDDSECCPGTFCNLASHACQSNKLQVNFECRADADCFDRFHDPAQFCQREAESDAGTCSYQSCQHSEDCASGYTCFKSWCVAHAPCGGTCPDGQVCEVETNTCHPVLNQGACAQSCAPGQVLVVDDPTVMTGDTCCPLICSCVQLPPLQPGVVGRFASVAIGNNEVLVSAYDESYGDLVVAHYTPQGELKWNAYIDGVPLGGALGGDPNGPRRGIIDPGPDIGQYTSLVVNARGEPRVAYYDVDNGDLRLALFDLSAGGWATHVVDAEQDSGRYASLIIDPATGMLRVAYRVEGITVDGKPGSAVRVATALVERPQSSADWSVVTLDRAALPDPCNYACTGNERCVLDGRQPRCQAPSGVCDPVCTSGQICVSEGREEPTCLATLPVDLAGLPAGLGLWVSLARGDADDLLVYYDAAGGDLKGVRVNGSGAGTPVVIDGDGVDGRHGGDVGRFASVAWDPSSARLGVVYEDVSRHTLRYYSGVDFTGGSFEVIEDGAGHPPGLRFVGADAALSYQPDGTAVVIYQDASFMDLALARRDPSAGTWARERLLADGAFGFDAAAAVTPNVAYVASAMPRLDVRRQLASRLLLFLRPL